MGSNLVIVAIPAEDDYVWKLSSEKVPHCTLLFLGDSMANPHVQQIVEFVEHAVTVREAGPFGLDVDYRGELGADKADVLFFDTKCWDCKNLARFRAQLLQDNNIKTAYDSTEQFPEWQPHLTMGYPATPAHEDKREFGGTNYVRFDRIAVWLGDFEGPEFRLRWNNESPAMEVGWSAEGATSVEEILSHHGVKGMRWGQTKTETITTSSGKTKMVTPKKAVKLDKQWEKNQFTLGKGIERHNAMASYVNARVGSLNDKYKDDDFSKVDWDNTITQSPRAKQYLSEWNKLNDVGFVKAVEQVHGVSPSGKKKMEIQFNKDGRAEQMVVRDVQLKHEDNEDNTEVFLFTVTRNTKGLITRVDPMEDSMTQTDSFIEDFLSHHGVKGMKWGVTKSQISEGAAKTKTEAVKRFDPTPGGEKTAVATTAKSIVPKGTQIKTQIVVSGGTNHPASPDALRVAEAKQKLHTSGVAALSNKELIDLQTRLNLERNVKTLAPEPVGVGRQFVNTLLAKNEKSREFLNKAEQISIEKIPGFINTAQAIKTKRDSKAARAVAAVK